MVCCSNCQTIVGSRKPSAHGRQVAYDFAYYLSEKGFYIMAFLLSLFGAVAVQKNIRDLDYLRMHTQPPSVPHYSQTPFENIEHDDEKN